MFLSKAQALATAASAANAALLDFAKKKIEMIIQTAAESGDSDTNRKNATIAFRYSDDPVIIASAFQSFADAGYTVSAESVTTDGNTRLRIVSWS